MTTKWCIALAAVVALVLGAVALGPLLDASIGAGVIWVLSPLALLGVAVEAASAPRVRAERTLGTDGVPKGFALGFRTEVIQLEPKKAWQQVDHFKWVTRGVIEEPQSFHVHPDGSVDINGENIPVSDPNGAARLEAEINKRHAVVAIEKPIVVVPKDAPPSDRSVFRVHLDHLGHMQIECRHGTEKAETGLRGLASLVQNGLMLPVRELHVDPLQQYVDLDGVRFEVNPEGARALEETLNSRYAAKLGGAGGVAVEIKENAGSATGFDIHFVTIRAGAKFEIKGHLSQENLDILQDQAKCDLLRPGIVLKISPPFLFIRRRRPDGGEEPIPEFPDLRYRSVTAAKLQTVFNHPLLRQGDTAAGTDTTDVPAADLVRLNVTRNPENRRFLWLEAYTAAGGPPSGRALTHHNLADLQHAGVFRPELDVSLSLDHQTLSILNQTTREEQSLTLDPQSADTPLALASELLTAALKPARPFSPKPTAASASAPATPAPIPVAEPTPEPPTASPPPAPPPSPLVMPPPPTARTSPVPAPSKSWDTVQLTKPAVAAAPPLEEPEPPAVSLFSETDGLRVTEEVFTRLGRFFCLPVQPVRLSLPHVFTDRLFEVISFEGQEVVTLFDLRSEEFYGFYRAHINEHNAVLVYACKGLHVEFGPQRCLIELSLGAEPHEFKGSGLLGFAQDVDHHEVFVVTPAFKSWVKPHERACEAGFAHFLTPQDFAAAPDRYHLVWPEAAAT